MPNHGQTDQGDEPDPNKDKEPGPNKDKEPGPTDSGAKPEAGTRPSETVDSGTPDNSRDTSTVTDAVSAITQVAAVPVVTFELKAIRQVEKGRFSFDLNTRQAAQKSFMPQHLLGFLTDGISKTDPQHYLRIRMDDPFYQKMRLLLDPPGSKVYSLWGLKSVKADVLYNNRQINAEASKSSFDERHCDRTELVTAWRPEVERAYEYVVTYNFGSRASTDWESKDGRTSYTFKYREPPDDNAPTKTVINLSPDGELIFMAICIEPSKHMDARVIRSVEVEMRYQDYVPGVDKDHPKSLKGEAPSEISRTYVVDSASKPQFFRVRTSRKEDRANCSYRLSYKFNQDEQTVQGGQTPWRELGSSRLEIEGPSTFEVGFDFWDLDPKDVRMVRIKLVYQDEANGYSWEKSVRKASSDLQADQEYSFRVPVVDVGAKKELAYEVQVVWQGGAKEKERLTRTGNAPAGRVIRIVE